MRFGEMSPNQPLPPKENAIFKKFLKCYEFKHYKYGLKLAKIILSNPKFADHAETLAMKGLILNHLRKKEEAYDHVKRALKSDVKSHVCWHVFGLLQRSDRKHDDAIRAYRNALRCDSDNIQVLHDLSLSQIQVRDLEGYKETRHRLFNLQPTQKPSWIRFAMSCHLLNDYDMAVKLLDEFLKIQNKTGYDYEQSELLLYQIQIVFESGDFQEVLSRIDKNESLICDKLTLIEIRADVYLKLSRYSEARELFEELIRRNQENKSYYEGLIKARQFGDNDLDRILEMYDQYRAKYPRAQMPRRLPLNVARGSTFRSLVDVYMRSAIAKGVPPLFAHLKSLYADKEKSQIINDLVEMYLKNLRDHQTFDGPQGVKQPVTALVWACYFACQYFDYHGNTQRALEVVDKAIEHTPTLIELYVAKAKILKHSGNMSLAVQCLDQAQSLDTADRYINSKCAKYMLRAQQISEAEAMCAKFTRENVSAMENLNEMQCMWFQTECAEAYARLRQRGAALRKCHEVERHFVEITEDQFEFHTYCMRKMTLRSYVGLLRLQDAARAHPFFFKAARLAIKIYLELYDHPLGDKKTEQDELESKLTKSELKKLRNKQKRAMEKSRMEEKENKQKEKKPQNTEEEKVDNDLDPEKLERPACALTEALKFLRPLQNFTPNHVETHLLSYEVYKRRARPLLMLRSILRAHRCQPDNPTLHRCLIDFVTSIVGRKDLSKPTKTVIDMQMSGLLGRKSDSSIDPKELNSTFLENNKKSYPHVIAAARVMYELDPLSKQKEALEWITLQNPVVTLRIDRFCCEDALHVLKDGRLGSISASVVDAFQAECARRFPLAEAFSDGSHILSDNSSSMRQTEQQPLLSHTTNFHAPAQNVKH